MNHRSQDGHGYKFEQPPSFDKSLAEMPKGTLPMRTTSSRSNGYNPERVVIQKLFKNKPVTPVKPTLRYGPALKSKLIKDAIQGLGLREIQVPDDLVVSSLNKAYEVFGEVANGMKVGPSASQREFPPNNLHNLPVCKDGDWHRLQRHATRLLRESIVSQQLLLQRYHQELEGNVTVLPYPHQRAHAMSKGNPEMVFTRYNTIGK